VVRGIARGSPYTDANMNTWRSQQVTFLGNTNMVLLSIRLILLSSTPYPIFKTAYFGGTFDHDEEYAYPVTHNL
jgi:hypothetical protein